MVRYGKTYREFAEELADVTGPFPLKPAIRSLRLLLGIPLAVYRAYPSQKQGRGRKKEFTVKVWFPFPSDKDLDVNFKFVNIINNGIDYIVPAVDSNIHKMNSRLGIVTESINTGILQCESMISCLPKSDLKTAVQSIRRHLRAAENLASTACLTTGTADLTCLKTSPLPVMISPVKSATTRKRGPPTSTASAPETEQDVEEDENPFAKKQKPSKTRVTSTELDPDKYRQNTTLPVNMCYCGQNFGSKVELDIHIKTTHEVQGWLCGDSACTKIYENKNVLFKHVRTKHLMLLNFKCDQCPKTYEEWNSMRAHR